MFSLIKNACKNTLNSKKIEFSKSFTEINNIDIDSVHFDVNILPCNENTSYVSGEIIEQFLDELEIEKIGDTLKIKTPRLKSYVGPPIGRMDIKTNNIVKTSIESNASCECKISVPVQDLDIESHGTCQFSIDNPVENLSANFHGTSSISLDSVANANISIHGISKITIDKISSSYTGNISGTGSVNIASGYMELLQFAVSGSGKFRTNATVQNANVSLSGTGLIHIDHVINDCNTRVTGTGQIKINKRG